MIECPVPVPAAAAAAGVAALVDAACDATGLTVTLRGTLRQYPGSVHWHCKRGQVRGTLEVTWWPAGRRLWLSVQAGRQGEWTDAALAHVAAELARLLADAGCNRPGGAES